MNLIDGGMAYQHFAVAEFMDETTTWSPGIHGVLCDDASEAYDNLASTLITYNALLGRSLSVYNYDSDKMNYYRIDTERFEFNFDRIHRVDWRRFAIWQGRSEHPSTNENSLILPDYLKSQSIASSSYVLLFLTIPSCITEIDFYGSQVAVDYTYGSVHGKYLTSDKNMVMKRNSNLYYVYDQVDGFFYKFPLGG